MNKIIVDYKKLTKEILAMLVEKYPDGYSDDDIIVFKNAKNETVEALEVRTQDTIYLVKVSTRLADSMENFDEQDDDFHSEIGTSIKIEEDIVGKSENDEDDEKEGYYDDQDTEDSEDETDAEDQDEED